MDAFSRLRGAAETRPGSAHGLAPAYRRLAVLAGIALGWTRATRIRSLRPDGRRQSHI
jgi:hypothetical protein